MRAERHQGTSLAYLTILPDDYRPGASYPLVIMLHGFGANMRDLAGLAPQIDRCGYVYACPNAPLPFDLGYGQVGYGWMAPRGQATPQEIRQAETLLAEWFEEVFQKLPSGTGRAVLLGFSQGGAMTYRCGLPRPEIFAGLVALSSSLPDPGELEGRLPQDRSQPIFVAHGLSDPLIPVERARATRQFLEEAGYRPEYREYPMGHEIPQPVLNDLVPWLTKVLPPWRDPE